MLLHVEDIGTYRLVLNSGFVLELEKTLYVPSFYRNLISNIKIFVPLVIPFNFRTNL